jgi:hypothetical protein
LVVIITELQPKPVGALYELFTATVPPLRVSADHQPRIGGVALELGVPLMIGVGSVHGWPVESLGVHAAATLLSNTNTPTDHATRRRYTTRVPAMISALSPLSPQE